METIEQAEYKKDWQLDFFFFISETFLSGWQTSTRKTGVTLVEALVGCEKRLGGLEKIFRASPTGYAFLPTRRDALINCRSN